MTDFRTPAHPDYLSLIGRAVFNFTYYEWVVIYTIEEIQPGYLSQYWFDNRVRTSGVVAGEFERAIANTTLIDDDMRVQLSNSATEFKRLVEERNRLLHSHPLTGRDDAQHLFYHGRLPDIVWESATILEAARQFEQAGEELHNLFYQLRRARGLSD